MFCFCFFFALLHLLFTSNSVVFVDGGRKIVSCPGAQGTLAMTLCMQKRLQGNLCQHNGKIFFRTLY